MSRFTSTMLIRETFHLFSVYTKTPVSVTVYFKYDFSGLYRSKHTIISSREVRQIYSRSENRGTRSAETERSGDLSSSHRAPFTRQIIPVTGSETRTIRRLALAECTMNQGSFYPRATLFINQFIISSEQIPYSIQNSYSVRRHSIVISPLHDRIIGIGAHNSYCQPSTPQRQKVILIHQ